MTGEASASLAGLDDERASSGEIRNARAVICLANGDPAAALDTVQVVLDGAATVIDNFTAVEAHLLAGPAHRELATSARRARPPKAPSLWPSPTGWSCPPP
jgi:LuxR family maltose regulon positive regulatory protein